MEYKYKAQESIYLQLFDHFNDIQKKSRNKNLIATFKGFIENYNALISFKISFVTRTAAALLANNAFSSAFNL